jgi:hypothetical protein
MLKWKLPKIVNRKTKSRYEVCSTRKFYSNIISVLVYKKSCKCFVHRAKANELSATVVVNWRGLWNDRQSTLTSLAELRTTKSMLFSKNYSISTYMEDAVRFHC